jgi:methanogenic corrinoid protein MtbC1
MIRWCAYCQKFLGEVPPFSEFTLTHGVCATCKVGAARISSTEARDLRALGAYYAELRDATRNSFERATTVLDRGLALGLAPVDLMMGMLQPALHEMGQRWAVGERRVYDEHQLTALSSAILELAFDRRPELTPLRQLAAPAVILVIAEGNAHTLGLRIVEYHLLDRGLPVFTIAPGLPIAEVCELTRALRPQVLGVSVALPEQISAVRALGEAVLSSGEPGPALVAGGNALRHDRYDLESFGFRIGSSPMTLYDFAYGARSGGSAAPSTLDPALALPGE